MAKTCNFADAMNIPSLHIKKCLEICHHSQTKQILFTEWSSPSSFRPFNNPLIAILQIAFTELFSHYFSNDFCNSAESFVP